MPYRLYSTPSFLEGLGRLFDFGNTLSEYNYSNSGTEADCKAIYSDWQQVGNDILVARQQFFKMNQETLNG